MRGVWVRVRAELRSSWKAWLALAILIGVAGGGAVGAVAGARRTATAYPRLVTWSKASDLSTGGFPEKLDPETVYSTIEHLPSVADWARVDLVGYGAVLPSGKLLTVPDIVPATDLRGRVGFAFDRFKVLRGRRFDPKAPGEAMVEFPTAERYGLEVGSVVRVVDNPSARHPKEMPVRIVGVVVSPFAFPAFGSINNGSPLILTPAFASAHEITPDPRNATLFIRVKGGQAGVPAFRANMRRAGLGDVDLPYFQATRTAGVQKSLQLEAAALWALAGVIVLAAGAVLGQSLARQTYQASADFPTLRAVGISRRQLLGLGTLRAALVGAVGAAVAVAVALLLSPLAPIGLARVAEPHPGFAADIPVLLLGAVAVLSLTVLIAIFPAWHAARTAARAAAADAERPSALANAVTRSSISPSAGVGVRMALESGRGRTAVPVRSAILGATLAIATLVASVLFYTSVQHLLRTPRLSGFAWDVFAAADTAKDNAAIEAALKADPDVAGWTRGGYTNLKIAGRSVFGIDTGGGGAASPVVVDGRAPTKADEIALGAASMRDASVGIGDTLLVQADSVLNPTPPVRMRVVGEVVIPPAPFGETLGGEGAVLTLDAARRLEAVTERSSIEQLPFLVRFGDGVDAEAAFQRLQAKLPQASLFPSRQRGDVSTLGRITRVPLALALLLGLIALATLAQTLVTSVRARRRDLAILKTLGFSRRQVRGTVAWQASTLVVLALVFGIPLGIVAGRWAWGAFAQGIAVVPAPVLSPMWVVVGFSITVLLANAIAALPARSAARTKPAVVLRSE